MDDHGRNNMRQKNEHPVLDENRQRDDQFEQEVSSEFTRDDINSRVETEEINEDSDLTSPYGWIGIALSVLSFFILPIVFAVAGIILGFVARNRDAVIIGNTAIIIGVISLLVRLFFVPFV